MIPVTQADVSLGAERLGLAGRPICLHASLRSFPVLENGAATLIDGLLDADATVLVATMANDAFAVPPPIGDRPDRNAIDYAEKDRLAAAAPWPGLTDIYDHTRTDVDSWLGATSAYVATRPDRLRCRRTPDFSAVGPLAEELMAAEVEADVFGPLRALAAHSGWVLLAGVTLVRMTLLHLAEVEAGRNPFIRWMRGPDGSTIRCRGGECSLGFDRLASILEPIERSTAVGESLWRAFPAAETVNSIVAAIGIDGSITHCDNPGCIQCPDAIAGGPLE